jgi:hypothetical protein
VEPQAALLLFFPAGKCLSASRIGEVGRGRKTPTDATPKPLSVNRPGLIIDPIFMLRRSLTAVGGVDHAVVRPRWCLGSR